MTRRFRPLVCGAQVSVEVDQTGSTRAPRRVSGRLGAAWEPGNQPIWGESPARRWHPCRRGAGVGPVVPEPVSSPGRRTTRKGDRPLVLNGRKRTHRAHSARPVRTGPRGRRRGRPRRTPAQAEPDIDDVKARVDRSTTRPSRPRSATTTPSSSSRSCATTWRRSRPTSAARTTASAPSRRRSRTRSSASTRARASPRWARSSSPRTPRPSSRSSPRCRPSTTCRAQLFDDYSTELKALDIRRQATEKRAAEVAATAEEAGRREGHDRRQARRGQVPARQARGRAARGACTSRAAPRRDALGRARPPAAPPPPSSTPWPRSATPTSTAPPAPSAFDCSGPDDDGLGPGRRRRCRTPRAPSTAPARTSRESDLQPGDLVFYYSPISHVGMYIGNGMIVNAENPSAGVKVDEPALDAVRRRGPPWLTPPVEGRSPTLVGGRPFAVPAAGRRAGSPGWCSAASRTWPPPRTGPRRGACSRRWPPRRCRTSSAPSTTATPPRPGRLAPAGDDRGRAAARGRGRATPARCGCVTSRCATSTRRARVAADGAWAAAVDATWRFAGFDREPARAEVTVRFVDEGGPRRARRGRWGRPALAAVADRPARRCAAPPRTLVLVAGSAQRGRRVRPRGPRRAVPVVRRVLPQLAPGPGGGGAGRPDAASTRRWTPTRGSTPTSPRSPRPSTARWRPAPRCTCSSTPTSSARCGRRAPRS